MLVLLGESFVVELGAVDGLATGAIALGEVTTLARGACVVSQRPRSCVRRLRKARKLTWIMNCLMTRWKMEPL